MGLNLGCARCKSSSKLGFRSLGTSFQLSTLTAPSNRNPQGVTLPRYLRLIATSAVEASLSSSRTFALYSLFYSSPLAKSCNRPRWGLLRKHKCSAVASSAMASHCPLLMRSNYSLIFTTPICKEGVDVFVYLFCRLCRSLTSILCCIF